MSIKPTILVTTAAGKTGRMVCQVLLKKGYVVRAFVHRNDQRAMLLKDAGAEIFIGDMNEIEDIKTALKGTHRTYLCMPPGQHLLSKALPFIITAQEFKLESLVWMGQWVADPQHHTKSSRDSHWFERLLHELPDIVTTSINPGWFADNYFLVMEPMAQLGLMPMPLGNGLNPPPSNEDMGRVIAALLIDPEPHNGKIYRPTGPKLLAPEEIASIIGYVLGRKIKYMNISENLFLKALKSQGYGEFFPSVLRYYTEDYRQNAFGMGGPTNVVEKLTGRPSEDFETIARRYAAELPEARQTIGNKLKAVSGLMKMLLAKPYHVKKLERKWEIPQLLTSRFATESPDWRSNHDLENAYSADQVKSVSVLSGS